MEMIISIFSTILTAIGTIITVVQSLKVRKYKQEIQADRIKNALISNIMRSETAKIEARKLKTSANSNYRRGVTEHRVIEAIEIYLNDVKELAIRFSFDELVEKRNEIVELIREFKSDQTEKKYVIGDDIESKLNDLIIFIKVKAYD
nr:hypothetical protein [Paenibacillus xylanexedens]